MVDNPEKTKEHLVHELEVLRQRIAELEASEAARKDAEEEDLRESEEKFRIVFNSSMDVVLIIDGESGRILSANPASRHMLGYVENLVTVNLWENLQRLNLDIETVLSIHGKKVGFSSLPVRGL